ncbi:type II secretion system F family protein [Paenibacillus senegalimassiliensis]|uniref:type II secretion system F family protein n=1 Tax=Paenibacillus senegalimassiliensis TaxID=1737426 RepID=UPI00073F5163|nr:type II secretion system F family protein [Paenibacillus senegalimassiliensis]
MIHALSAGLLLALAGGWLLAYRAGRPKYGGYAKLAMEGLRLQRLAPSMLYLLERIRVHRRLPRLFFRVQRAVQKLSGDRRGGELTLLFFAETLNYAWLTLATGCLLSLLGGGDPAGLFIGGILTIVIPMALINDLYRKVQRREQELMMELPELLNKIMLLVGAGSTVQQAIKLCLERRQDVEHPLYRELLQMQREWEGGDSFQQSMEGFSKRCGIQEVAAFTTTVLLNYRRGGQDFALALRDLSHSLWEKRKAVSKTLGEQASAKLVFPMALLFIVLLILVGAPAFMMMDL